jgi:single-strand DNA-binding protein
LRKGDPVTLQGRLSVRNFQDKEGRSRTSVEIDAVSVGHDLSRGVATFQRVRPQTGMTAAEFAASQETAGKGEAQAGSAVKGGWTDGGNDIAVPDEPDRPIVDEPANGEDSDAVAAAAA